MKDFDKIKKAMQCFSELKIEVKEAEDDIYGNQKGKSVVINGWISLVPLEVEENVRTIAGNRKHKVIRWDVEVLTHHIGDRDTPPEDDICPVAEKITLENACKKAWELITSNNVESVFENIEYEENLEDEAKYEKIEGI